MFTPAMIFMVGYGMVWYALFIGVALIPVFIVLWPLKYFFSKLWKRSTRA